MENRTINLGYILLIIASIFIFVLSIVQHNVVGIVLSVVVIFLLISRELIKWERDQLSDAVNKLGQETSASFNQHIQTRARLVTVLEQYRELYNTINEAFPDLYLTHPEIDKKVIEFLDKFEQERNTPIDMEEFLTGKH